MIENKAKKLNEIFDECLESGLTLNENKLTIEGLTQKFVFDKEKTEACGPEILSLLEEMNDKFKLGSGDGWSFLQLPFDKYGNHWCEHPTAERLLALGLALDLVAYLMPREMWGILPGGVPYIQLKIKPNGVKQCQKE